MPPTKKCVRMFGIWRTQVEKIVQAFGISHGRVTTILHDRLGMRELTAHWVPKSLSDE